jgi:hypothetical protein
MAKLPEERYQDGEDFVADCERLLASAPEGVSLRAQHDTRKRPQVSRLTPLPKSRVDAGPTGPTPQPGAKRSPTADAAEKPKTAMYAGIGAAVVLAIVVGGYFAFKPAPPAPGVVTPTAPITTTPTTPSIEPPPSHVEIPTTVIGGVAPTTADIPALLGKAGGYLREGLTASPPGHRLTSPTGDCALDLYRQVLQLDPANVEAQSGLRQIAMFFEGKARALLDRNMAGGAALLAEEGLKAEPDNANLKTLLESAHKSAGN